MSGRRDGWQATTLSRYDRACRLANWRGHRVVQVSDFVFTLKDRVDETVKEDSIAVGDYNIVRQRISASPAL